MANETETRKEITTHRLLMGKGVKPVGCNETTMEYTYSVTPAALAQILRKFNHITIKN